MSDTQQNWATLSRNFIAQQSCLSDIASCQTLLSSRATKLLHRNHLYSSAIFCSVAELSLVNWLFTCQLLIFVTVWMVDKSVEAINKALLIIMSSSVLLETMLVWRLFGDGKLTVAYATLLSNKVARQSCSTLLRVWHRPKKKCKLDVIAIPQVQCCHCDSRALSLYIP